MGRTVKTNDMAIASNIPIPICRGIFSFVKPRSLSFSLFTIIKIADGTISSHWLTNIATMRNGIEIDLRIYWLNNAIPKSIKNVPNTHINS
jgi:hypothetical protein